MKGQMDNQKLPDGTCHGRDLPDRGNKAGMPDNCGASGKDLDRGHTGSQGIGKDTKSDSE